VREFLSRFYCPEIQVCLCNRFSHSQSSGKSTSQSLLSRHHRKIAQMISSLCLLDIPFWSWFLFDNIAHWCSSDSFWLLRKHIRLFQEFYHCHHLASLLNLIHLLLFHCMNLILIRTRGRFHPSSNYLQYRPHVHYRCHSTHLNTPQRRCTTIPVLPWSVCHRTLSKHVAQ